MGSSNTIALSKTTKFIVDNRGKTAPTSEEGIALIATNCIDNKNLYPVFKKVRWVDQETYDNWFRSHPIPGDILLTLKGSQNGATCLVPDPVNFSIAQDMVGLRVNAEVIDPMFLFAALRSRDVQHQIKILDVSGVIPHLKKSDFDKLFLPYPDMDTQKIIGKTYYSLCKKIDLLHRQNKTLEAIAETLFRQWFVEEADESWEWSQLDTFIQVHRGLSYKGSGLTDSSDGIPMHNLNSVYEGGGYKESGIKYYNGQFKERHVVKPGDVIVTNTEQGHEHLLIGYPAIVPSTYGDKGIFSQHIYSLEITSNLTNFFLFHLLKTHDVHEQIAGATNGSTVNMLPKDGIEWVKFKLPPQKLIVRFTQIVNEYYNKQELNHQQIQTLINLRDTLLPKLMSGEVKVKIN